MIVGEKMVSNKQDIIKEMLQRDIYKLNEYSQPINNGKTFKIS